MTASRAGSDAHAYGSYPWLSRAENAATLVLTSSRRLARELGAEFAGAQLAQGRSAWTTPEIYFWRDWCAKRYASDDARRLVEDVTSDVLWESCLRQRVGVSLVNDAQFAALARSTWRRLQEWDVPLGEVSKAAATADERAFAEAARAYTRELERRGWIDRDGLTSACVQQLADGAHTVPDVAIAVGFDRTVPLVARLFSALRDRGCAVETVESQRAGQIHTQTFADRDTELRAVGQWARQLLSDRPAARIGVVIPDLHARAATYRRLLAETFAAGWQLGGEEYAHAIDVSYGQPLADYPVTVAALSALRCVSDGLRSRSVSVLARSPFFHGASAAAAATLDDALRHVPDRRWSAAGLTTFFGEREPHYPAIATRCSCFRRLAEFAAGAEELLSPSRWALRIDELLRDIGWPGERGLGSRDFQVIERWHELLQDLAALDLVTPKLTGVTAIHQLIDLARRTVFQPESRHARVKLMGVLEAAGLQFDYLWVAGMEASQWPPAAYPAALVARRLQRERGLPDATPGDTLQYARRVTNRLAASAPCVYFSSVRHSGHSSQSSDSPQSPSPLLRELSESAAVPVEDPGWFAARFVNAARVCDVARDSVPPMVDGERLFGGAYTINRQMQEPFSAFAAGRLQIREVQAFAAGMTPRLRGILLHDSLRELLSDRPSHATLCGWNDTDLARRIQRATERAFAGQQRQADAVLRRLLAIERQRQHGILENFLEHERQRDAFTIESVETPLKYEHGGIRVTMRADRIDRLADGAQLIIDYKSGAGSGFLNRLGEPNDYQSMLYGLAVDGPVGGLLLIYLSPPDPDYRGVGGSVPWGKVSASEWPRLMSQWRERIHAAFDDLARGDVRIASRTRRRGAGPFDLLSRVVELDRA